MFDYSTLQSLVDKLQNASVSGEGYFTTLLLILQLIGLLLLNISIPVLALVFEVCVVRWLFCKRINALPLSSRFSFKVSERATTDYGIDVVCKEQHKLDKKYYKEFCVTIVVLFILDILLISPFMFHISTLVQWIAIFVMIIAIIIAVIDLIEGGTIATGLYRRISKYTGYDIELCMEAHKNERAQQMLKHINRMASEGSTDLADYIKRLEEFLNKELLK